MSVVEIAKLPIKDELGKGGFARIHKLPGHTVRGETGPFVLKRYHSTVLDRYSGIAAGLHALIAFRSELTPRDRQRLDARTLWPLQIATENGQVVGLIMRQMSDRFLFEMPLTLGGTRRVAREAQMYFCAPKRSARNGLPPMDFRVRVMALARFASQLGFLHDKGVIVGDIQGSNVAVDPAANSEADVRICMVDSDSYRTVRCKPAIPQGHAMSWDPPEHRQLKMRIATSPPGRDREILQAQVAVQTKMSDVYKFGLFAIRLLAMTNGISTSCDPAIARDTMQRQLGIRRTNAVLAALQPIPANRPKMSEITSALSGQNA